MRRPLLVLVALALVSAGCGQRERLNPFDPGNPQTGGRPRDFMAFAGDQLVTLRWATIPPNTGVRGYELFRSLPGDSTFTQISGLLPPTTTALGDFQLQNGVAHTYRLFYVFDRGLGPLAAEDIATPGPLTPWVADLGTPATLRLTADGRRVQTQDDAASGPTDVAVDNQRGVVWISDPFGSHVIVFSPGTNSHAYIDASSSPGAIALDPSDGTAWVCDNAAGSVFHFQLNTAFASPPSISNLDHPIHVTLDPGDRSLWICEHDGNRVRHFSPAGAPLGTIDVGLPSRASVDSATHAAWVTSFTHGRVYVVSNLLALRDTIGGFLGPIGIAVDARRDRVWVADAVGNRVIALHRNGTPDFTINGLDQPREIALDHASGEAWVTLEHAGAVARLSPAGTVIQITGGMKQPLGLSLGGNP